MRQVAGLIPTYSSDEFGICSALFELGGMVVMHDASGCNSTYTTHDEPRWYDTDSMIFISAISEMEAIMGDDDKLIRDLIETAEDLHPAFIAVVGAPIPYMIGTDLPAIATVVEQETGIPSFGFSANGMHDYSTGISMALWTLANRFCLRDIQRAKTLTVNLIGATPLDFSVNGSIDSIREWLLSHDMQPGACFAMGSTLKELREAGQAQVNLVLSSGGLSAAQRLRELFGTPYVTGVPFGKAFADKLAENIRYAAETGENVIAYRTDATNTSVPASRLAIIGEAVTSASLAAAIELETGIPMQVFCPLETGAELLRAGDLQTPEEDDLILRLLEVAGVIADPLYQPLCSKGMAFYPLAHEAFSGRIYETRQPEKYIPNLIDRSLLQSFIL